MILSEYEIHAMIAANADILIDASGNKTVMKEIISRFVQLIEMLPDDSDMERTVQ